LRVLEEDRGAIRDWALIKWIALMALIRAHGAPGEPLVLVEKPHGEEV
jgi:hypothetical protein